MGRWKELSHHVASAAGRLNVQKVNHECSDGGGGGVEKKWGAEATRTQTGGLAVNGGVILIEKRNREGGEHVTAQDGWRIDQSKVSRNVLFSKDVSHVHRHEWHVAAEEKTDWQKAGEDKPGRAER